MSYLLCTDFKDLMLVVQASILSLLGLKISGLGQGLGYTSWGLEFKVYKTNGTQNFLPEP